MRPSRRLLLQGLGALVGTTLVRPASAGKGTNRRFVFVVSDGGWDPLAAFAPMFGSKYIEMGGGAEAGQVGGLAFVDHPDRPSVRAYFERWKDTTALINGVSVPSVSHDVCRLLALTGSSGGERADWPTLLGVSTTATTLPSLVLSGPSFPGAYGVASARAGSAGQLQRLLNNDIFWYSDTAVGTIPRNLDATLDAALEERFAVLSSRLGAAHPLAAAFTDAHARLGELRGYRNVDFSGVWDQASRIDLAVTALAAGLSRCVTLTSDGAYGYWDSHTDNESTQSLAFEVLFEGLSQLQESLATTLDPDGVPLSETTIVVALSEMGRTPTYNGSDGRDHWPFTSVLMTGPGLVGNQVISGFDDAFYGLGYDAELGAEVADGTPLTPEHIGATLLALADVDPGVAVPNASPISPLLP